MQVAKQRCLYKFGDWIVVLDRNQISRDGEVQHLEPKVADVLACLLEQAGEVVSQNDIINTVWHDRVVEPVAVARNIARIRQVLGDSPQNPRYIETIAKRGYRTVAKVTSIQPGEDPAAVSSASEPTRLNKVLPATIALVGLLLLVLIGSTYFSSQRAFLPAERETHVLAVLPLRNASTMPTEDFIGEGLTIELNQVLGKIAAFSMISHQSTRQYRDSDKPASQIARELDIDAVLSGSVTRSGDRIHVTLELTDARTDRVIWSESYDRHLSHILRVQSEVALAVANQLQVTLAPEKRAAVITDRSVNPDVYPDFLRAIQLTSDPNGPRRLQNLPEAIRMLEEVVSRDPNFPEGWAALSEARAARAWFALNLDAPQRKALVDQAGDAAETAIALDGQLYQAHRAMAHVHSHRHDFNNALRSMRNALQLNPSDTENMGVYAYGLRGWTGNFKQVLELARTAVRLDPLDAQARRNLAEHLIVTRHYELGLAAFAELGDDFTDPDLETRAYIALDRHEEAYQGIRRQLEACGLPCGANAQRIRRGWESQRLRGALRAFRNSQVESAGDARSIASLSVWLGENDVALEWLEKGVASRQPNFDDIRVQYWFDPLRTDPRYAALLQRAGYPPWDPDPGVLADTGRALALVGRVDDAMSHLQQALADTTGDARRARWLVSLGLAHFAAERFAQAGVFAKQALEHEPLRYTREDALLLLAASLGQLERPDEAAIPLKTALATWPDLAQSVIPLPPFTESSIRQRYTDGLIEAGLGWSSAE